MLFWGKNFKYKFTCLIIACAILTFSWISWKFLQRLSVFCLFCGPWTILWDEGQASAQSKRHDVALSTYNEGFPVYKNRQRWVLRHVCFSHWETKTLAAVLWLISTWFADFGFPWEYQREQGRTRHNWFSTVFVTMKGLGGSTVYELYQQNNARLYSLHVYNMYYKLPGILYFSKYFVVVLVTVAFYVFLITLMIL